MNDKLKFIGHCCSFILATLFLYSPETLAQCTLSIEGPETTNEVTVVYKVNLDGAPPDYTPRFHWKISAGTIVSGQGSSQITVDTRELGGTSIEVSVEVLDLSISCSGEVKQTTRIIRVSPYPLAFDKFGRLRFEDLTARLDKFAIGLKNLTDARGAIIVYATRPKERQDHIIRVRNYLKRAQGISTRQLVFIDGGYRQDFTTALYIVPKGALLPTPQPEPSPTRTRKN